MNLFEELETWRTERNMDKMPSHPINVLKHMMLEITEAMEAYVNGDRDGWADGILDTAIYGINGLEQNDFCAEEGMHEVLLEIHSRKGSYDEVEGKFKKEITGDEYKADLSKCWRS